MDTLRQFLRLARQLPLSEEAVQFLRTWPVIPGVVFGLIPFIWILLITWWSAARTDSLPWWEKARSIFPMRSAIATAPAVSLLPAVILIIGGARHSSVPDLLSGLIMGLASWMVSGFIAQWLDARLIRREFHAGRTLAALAPAFLLQGVFVCICVTAITIGGDRWTPKLFASVAAATAASFGWFHYCLPYIMLRLTKDPPPELVEAVKAALPPGGSIPPVRVLRSDTVNAIAMIGAGWIAFTRGAVKHLNPEEITAVARHELAHLSEPSATVRRRQLILLGFTPFLFIRPMLATFDLVLGILLIVGASTLLAKWLRGKDFQQLEQHADTAAADDAGIYARTLERIYELNVMPVVVGVPNQAHPELYDRMIAAGVTPSFPRPQPPAHVLSKTARALNFLTLLLLAMLLSILMQRPQQ